MDRTLPLSERYDGVLHRLVNAAKATRAVAVNRCVAGVDEEFTQLRPDIVIRDDVQRKVTIIDVAIPFENRISEKLSKYHPLAENLRRNGYEVIVDAFLVGSLGAWDTANERAMSLLGINRRYAVMMRKLMVSETIRWSRNIYVEHVSGVRQYIL